MRKKKKRKINFVGYFSCLCYSFISFLYVQFSFKQTFSIPIEKTQLRLNELMGIDLEKNFTDVRMVFQMDGRIFECTSSTIVTTDSNGFSKETYLFRPVSKNNNNENNKQTTTESIQLDDLRLCGFIPFETMSEKEKSGLSIIFNQPKDGEQSKIQQPIRTAIATRRIDSNNEGRFQIIAETVHSSYLRGARFTYEIKTEKPLTIQQQNEIVNRWLSTLSVGFA